MRLGKGHMIALVGAVAGLVLGVLGVVLTASPAEASSTRSFLVTLYGWPDNSPPGDAIAYPKSDGEPTIHDAAGGVGTYANPVTFATDKSELPVGTIVYYAYLHRYFIMEDDCTECDADWSGQGSDGGRNTYHIDLWIGGHGGDSNDVIDCEDALTQSSAKVTLNPPSDEPVDTTPLFNSSSNRCYDPASFKGASPTPSKPATPKSSPSAKKSTPAARRTSSDPGSPSSPSSPSPDRSASRSTSPRPSASAAPSGSASATSPAPTASSYTAIAGPGCANSPDAEFVGVGFSGDGTDDWNVIDGNDGTGSGCSDRFLAMPMSGTANKDAANRGLWVFTPSPAATEYCTFRVYIPKPPSSADGYEVDGTSAVYGVFSGSSVSGASRIGQFTLDQTAHRGGSVLEGSFEITQPLLVVRLYDRGVDYNVTPNAMYGVAAIQVSCS